MRKEEKLKKKYAIYIRVSKKDRTPINQKLILEEFAEKSGWKYDIYSEVESTRKTRPIKQEVLAKLRQRQYDGLLIYKLDRWARNSVELILELEELYKKGISIISYADTLDFSTPVGKLQFKILCIFAEFERDLISERTKAGLERARKQGKKLGRPRKQGSI